MTRTLTPAVQTATQQPHVVMCLLLEMQFTGGTVYFSDLTRDVVWNGNTYIGVGNLGAVDDVRDAANKELVGLRFQITGLPSGNIFLALSPQEYKSRAVILRVAWFDATALTVITDPVEEWTGVMDMLTTSMEGGSWSVGISCESEIVTLTRPLGRFYSDEDHQLRNPGDTFFKLLNTTSNKTIVWPSRELQFQYANQN